MTHNTRFPDIWEILTSRIDFNGQKIFDVGFGHGDLLRAAWGAGAIVYGCEIDRELIEEATHELKYIIFQSDVNEWSDDWYPFKGHGRSIDLLTCFSVLPYLDNPDKALRYFKEIAKTSLIECQYYGDGPGTIRGSQKMEDWLSTIWKDVKVIGQTFVESRERYRDIWLCQ